jgi:hypothetical protein
MGTSSATAWPKSRLSVQMINANGPPERARGNLQCGYELLEFQDQLKQYPPGTEVSAFFFHRVAVPGMCLGELASRE